MGVITLLTDFGLEDEYAGVMKGVILSRHPQACIVDITHQVPPQNVLAASLILEASWRFFPPATVHLAVVDPCVGSDRRILAARVDGHFFLAPDNGLLSPVLDARADVKAFWVENASLFLPEVSRTFHGRDIFAPAAAHAASTGCLEDLGPPAAPGDAVRLSTPRPREVDGVLEGSILWVDHFGNLVTNIPRRQLETFAGEGGSEGVIVQIGGRGIHGVSDAYAGVEHGGLLALIGSKGLLEISVRGGHAANVLGVRSGQGVAVRKCGY